jgi:hypothetical protein
MASRRKIVKTKVGILEPARQLGNAPRAREAMGHSRDSFHRFEALYETLGEAATARSSGRKPNEKNRADPIVERVAADFACEQASYGR